MPKGRVQINVVQHDIDRAIRADSSRCVVATAVARAVADATRIEVDTQTIRFTSGGKRLAYLTPLTVQGYVAAFDAGDPISPFSFQLRDPMELRRKLAPDAVNRAADASNKKLKLAAKKAAVSDEGVPSSVAYQRVSRLDTPGRTPPPRVFKLKVRTYGHRQLRINRPRVETATP